MVLNEKQYAIDVLSNCEFEENVTSTLFIIAKYLRHTKGNNDGEILDELDAFMQKIYMDYNKVSWMKLFEKAIASSNKYQLIEIDYIPITKQEMDTIAGIKSDQEKRVMFAMLCYAKYYNLVNPENSNWVNTDAKILFKSAHVQKNVEEQYKMLYRLKEAGYINASKSIKTLNKQVNIIDDASEVVLHIMDFRDLGYEYLLYKGDNYIRCTSCGRLTKNNKNSTKKYCNDCDKYEAMKTKIIICIECGKEILVLSKDSKSERCDECYSTFRHDRKLETQRIRREIAIKSE